MSDAMEYEPDPAWEAYCIENNIGGRGEPDLLAPRNTISPVERWYEAWMRMKDAADKHESITLSCTEARDVEREISRLRDELQWWMDRRP